MAKKVGSESVKDGRGESFSTNISNHVISGNIKKTDNIKLNFLAKDIVPKIKVSSFAFAGRVLE
jgi:hypothetical protein